MKSPAAVVPPYPPRRAAAAAAGQPGIWQAPVRSLARIDLRMRMHRDLDEVSYLYQLGVISVYEANDWLAELWDRYIAMELDLRAWEEATGC